MAVTTCTSKSASGLVWSESFLHCSFNLVFHGPVELSPVSSHSVLEQMRDYIRSPRPLRSCPGPCPCRSPNCFLVLPTLSLEFPRAALASASVKVPLFRSAGRTSPSCSSQTPVRLSGWLPLPSPGIPRLRIPSRIDLSSAGSRCVCIMPRIAGCLAKFVSLTSSSMFAIMPVASMREGSQMRHQHFQDLRHVCCQRR